MPNGLMSKNDEEASDALVENFAKAFNKSAKVGMEHAKAIPRKNDFEEISGQMAFDESQDVPYELAWHKAGGDN